MINMFAIVNHSTTIDGSSLQSATAATVIAMFPGVSMEKKITHSQSSNIRRILMNEHFNCSQLRMQDFLSSLGMTTLLQKINTRTAFQKTCVECPLVHDGKYWSILCYHSSQIMLTGVLLKWYFISCLFPQSHGEYQGSVMPSLAGEGDGRKLSNSAFSQMKYFWKRLVKLLLCGVHLETPLSATLEYTRALSAR